MLLLTRACALLQTHLMIAEDPIAHVGSGGATLNALLAVTEFLSSADGHTVVNAESIVTARILIAHLVLCLLPPLSHPLV